MLTPARYPRSLSRRLLTGLLGGWLAALPLAGRAAEADLHPTGPLLVNGDFEQPAGETGEIPGWRPRPDSDVDVVAENGNSFLRLRNTDPAEAATCGQEFALKPEWKKLRLTLRARVQSITPGKEGWHDCRLAITFKNAAGQVWHKAVPTWKQAAPEWREYQEQIEIPEGADLVGFAPAIFNAAGEADFDDLSVVALSTRAEDAAVAVQLPAPPPAAAPDPALGWGREPVETPTELRGEICLNGVWNFQPAHLAAPLAWGTIRVPGSWKPASRMVPGIQQRGADWPNFNAAELDRAWYERTVDVPAAWAGRAIVLRLERVSTDALVFVNGREAGWVNWPDGERDLTELVTPGQSARLSLFVMAATSQAEITRYMGTGKGQVTKEKAVLGTKGLIGDVLLQSRPRGAHVTDLFVNPSTRRKNLSLTVTLDADPGAELAARAKIVNAAGQVAQEFTATGWAVPADDGFGLQFAWDWANPHLWESDDPYLYRVELDLTGKNFHDCVAREFGFREFWIEGRDFYLNGVPLRLRTAPIHEYGIIAGQTELIEAELSGLKGCGFNLAEIWPNDRFERGLIEFDDLWCRTADRLGLLLIVPVIDIGNSIMSLERPRLARYWAAQMRRRLRPLRNHPSVVTWALAANRFCLGQDQNPSVMGIKPEMAKVGPGWQKRVSNYQVAQKLIQTFDPTRPVFSHAGNFAGDVYTTNNYLCVIPLQEREDWLSAWAERGDMPIISIEFGSPLYTTFFRGRNGYGGATTSEPWLTEFSAIYFGSDSFRNESPAYREDIRTTFESGQKYQTHHFSNLAEGIENNQAEFLALFNRNTTRSWRTWGTTGGMVPWGMHGWNRDTRVSRFKAEAPAVKAQPFQPGRRGTYQADYPRTYAYAYRPEGMPANAAAQAIIDNNQPTLAWLGGRAGEFTEKGHNFAAGATVTKQVILLNDTRTIQEYSWQVAVKFDGKPLIEKSGQGKLDPARTEQIPFDFALPATTAPRTSGVIELTARIGSAEQRDSFAFRVFAPPAAPQGEVTLLDPVGETSQALRNLGYAVKAWDGQTPGRIVVGRRVLSQAPAQLEKVAALVKAGGEALVMAQDPEWLHENLAWRLARHLSRRVFPVAGASLPGLDAEDLRDWQGTSTLIPPFAAEVVNGRYERTPEYGWRWGARGTVASCSVEKPHFSSWTPLMEDEFDLAYSPLMELRYGQGRLRFCGLDLEDHGEEPAVREIWTKLLAPADLPPAKTEVCFLGGPDEDKFLRAAGLRYAPAQTLPAPGALAVIGTGAQVDDAALNEFLRQGGKALFLARRAAGALPLGATVGQVESFRGSLNVPDWAICRGLSPSDLRWRAEHAALLLTGGCEIGADGLLGYKQVGTGLAVYCQIDPEALDCEKLTYLRFTRWRQSRALCQLLSNLGGSFAADELFFSPRQARRDRQELKGVWQAKLIQRLPEVLGNERHKDTGPSQAALAAVQPDFAANDFQDVTLPSLWEEFGGEWAGADGEAVFRKVLEIPAEWAGRALRLSLGPVDDFDVTYWNGVQVGATGLETPNFYAKRRIYTVPAEMVKAGRAVLAVRVFDHFGGGGLYGKEQELFVEPADAPAAPANPWYHPDYREDFELGDDPYRYYRW